MKNDSMTDKSPLQRISQLEKKVLRLQSRIDSIRNFRLVVFFAAFGLLTLLTFNKLWQYEAPVLFIFLCTFVTLLIRTKNLELFLERLQLLKVFYQRQHHRQCGVEVSGVFQPPEKSELNSHLSRDLHIFGQKSIFNLVNETFSFSGLEKMSTRLLAPSLRFEDIQQMQKQVLQWQPHLGKIRALMVAAHRSKAPFNDQALLQFVTENNSGHISVLSCKALLAFWIFCFAHTSLSWFDLHFLPVSVTWVLFALASLSFLKTSHSAFRNTLQMAINFESYGQILKIVELLAIKEPQLLPLHSQKPPSQLLKKVETCSAALSTEANPLFHLILNAFLPWSSFWLWQLQKEKEKLKDILPEALKELSEFEYTASLAVMYRYSSTRFPNFSNDAKISFKNLYHPLIPQDRVVANSFVWPLDKKLILVTGSNMSGKSTFLRTFGVNQILAMAGAPVFAENFCTVLRPLESALSVSDSLNDGFSYFYAEVLRLKQILDRSQKEEIFFLIDEIFRGTNNRERLIGSESLISTLIETLGLGFITTHDLELTKLAEKSNKILNMHFRDDLAEGKMVFNYKLHEGPCPTTNALKIMALNGLPIPNNSLLNQN